MSLCDISDQNGTNWGCFKFVASNPLSRHGGVMLNLYVAYVVLLLQHMWMAQLAAFHFFFQY